MSLTGSKTGGRAILRSIRRSEKGMEIINMGGQISVADFGQFSFGVYNLAYIKTTNHFVYYILIMD